MKKDVKSNKEVTDRIEIKKLRRMEKLMLRLRKMETLMVIMIMKMMITDCNIATLQT